jgi:hypothetical protein
MQAGWVGFGACVVLDRWADRIPAYLRTTQGRIVEDWVDSEDVEEHNPARIGTVIPKAVDVSSCVWTGV